MIEINGLDVSGKDSFGRREDLSFIVRFQWKTSDHLKEAIQLLLSSRLSAIIETEDICEHFSKRCSENLNDREFEHIRIKIASNPNTPPAVLIYMAKYAGAAVLERIAENPRTPPSLLDLLSTHAASDIRAAVGENMNTSEDVLQRLSVDEDVDVRYRLAENPLLPRAVLLHLADDSNPYVASRAASTLSRVVGGRVVRADFRDRNLRSDDQQAQG